MESLIKNVKQGQGYMVTTYIGNAMTYSFSIDKDFLMGTKSQLSSIDKVKEKQKESIKWIDAKVRYNRQFARPNKSYQNELLVVTEKIVNNKQLLIKNRENVILFESKKAFLNALPKNPAAQGSTKQLRTIYWMLFKKNEDELKDILIDCKPMSLS